MTSLFSRLQKLNKEAKVCRLCAVVRWHEECEFELVAADLDALAALVGWDAVSRLRVGDVVSGGASYSLEETGSGDAPDSPGTAPASKEAS